MSVAGNNLPKYSSWISILSRETTSDTIDSNRVFFQFMPHSIIDTKNAVYQDVNIISRSTPVKSYAYSGARTIQFALEFFVHPEQGDTEYTPQNIKKTIDTLRSLVLPDYTNFIVKPPPRCLVHVGDQISFIGICRNVSVQYTNTSPWDLAVQTDGPGQVLAHHASVNLFFEEVLNIPLSFEDVKSGKGYTDSEFTGNSGN